LSAAYPVFASKHARIPPQFSTLPKAVDRFLRMPLSDETKRKFLWDNCARLYSLALI